MFFSSSKVDTSYSTWEIISLASFLYTQSGIQSSNAAQNFIDLLSIMKILEFSSTIWNIHQICSLFQIEKSILVSHCHSEKSPSSQHHLQQVRHQLEHHQYSPLPQSTNEENMSPQYKSNFDQIVVWRNHTHQSFNQIQITTYSRCVIFKAFDHFKWRSCKFWHCLIEDLMGTVEFSHGHCALQSGDDYICLVMILGINTKNVKV